MHDPDTSDPSTPICWFCSEPEIVDIADIWVGGDYALNTS